MPSPESTASADMDQRHEAKAWWSTRRLTLILLLAWGVLAFVGPWFARDIDALMPLHFPLSYWMSAQGALILFVVIVAIYDWRMVAIEDRLERDRRASNDRARRTPASGDIKA